MNIFDKYVDNLLESIIDVSRDSLDTTVFQFFEDGRPPILKDGIKAQILNDIYNINKIARVMDFFIIGSILTHNYNPRSDIDVNVKVDKERLLSNTFDNILGKIKAINSKLAIGTTHAINYYIITDDYDLEKTDGAYDVVNEKWIKTPKILENNINLYVKKFNDTLSSIDITTGELKRNLIDIDDLKKLKKEHIKYFYDIIKRKFDEVEENIKQLISIYHNVKTLREIAFDRHLTTQELIEIGNKNNLPDNVIYKLLEKYYYSKMIRNLEDFLDINKKVNFKNTIKIKDILKKADKI